VAEGGSGLHSNDYQKNQGRKNSLKSPASLADETASADNEGERVWSRRRWHNEAARPRRPAERSWFSSEDFC